MMHTAALLLGGNQGDRKALLQQATELIRARIGSVVALSAVLETEPWGEFGTETGGREPEKFLNLALLVETPLAPHKVLREALAIEHTLGRRRIADSREEQKICSPCVGEEQETGGPSARQGRIYHSRPIDIDIIFYDNAIIDTPDLTVPHPRMQLRRFVLEPLAEIMPDHVHPVLCKTVKQLLADL